MIYRLKSEECAWSLIGWKEKNTNVCCLRHASQVKVTEEWMSSVAYDPLQKTVSPYDIFVDENGNIKPADVSEYPEGTNDGSLFGRVLFCEDDVAEGERLPERGELDSLPDSDPQEPQGGESSDRPMSPGSEVGVLELELKDLCLDSSESVERSEETSSETIDGTAETPVDRAASF